MISRPIVENGAAPEAAETSIPVVVALPAAGVPPKSWLLLAAAVLPVPVELDPVVLVPVAPVAVVLLPVVPVLLTFPAPKLPTAKLPDPRLPVLEITVGGIALALTNP